jgi:hypothetical protein
LKQWRLLEILGNVELCDPLIAKAIELGNGAGTVLDDFLRSFLLSRFEESHDQLGIIVGT